MEQDVFARSIAAIPQRIIEQTTRDNKSHLIPSDPQYLEHLKKVTSLVIIT